MLLPEIATQRLRLTPFREEDIDALHRHWIDPDVRRWLWDDVVIPRERAAETVRGAIASAAARGAGMWSLFLREGDGELIGFCGFRELPDSDDIELLYGLYPAHWGLGLATEASRAALDFAFRELRVPRVYAGADPPNAESFKVMERLGMRLVPEGIPAVPRARYYAIYAGE